MKILVKKNMKRVLVALKKAVSLSISLTRPGARILMFHSVEGRPEDHPLATRISSERFSKELTDIARCDFDISTVTQMMSDMGRSRGKRRLAITFDDGFKDNFTVAAKILRETGLTATFFITVSYIEGTVKKRWANGAPREYMTWDDVRALSKMGFEIGSHMVRHVNLNCLSDAELRLEFTRSKEIISEKIGKKIETCSYPYGMVDKRVMDAAKEAGYLCACSSAPGLNDVATDAYMLKRTEIDGYDTMKDFRDKLKGWYD